jgi:hypothetical protein
MRNVVSPYFSLWETEPQGEAMEMRVADFGESECRLVMRWIGIQNLSRPERVQTSEWSFITRQSENSVETGVRRLGADLIRWREPGFRDKLTLPVDGYRKGLD